MIQVGLLGASFSSDEKVCRLAEEVGSLVGRKGWVLVCGGLSGAMEAAARGAKQAGGLTVGILPGPDTKSANPHIDIAIPTNMGHARNAVIAHAADALVAVGGGWGTLSEMALARKLGKTVVSLSSWQVSPEIKVAGTPQEAISIIEEALGRERGTAAGNHTGGTR